MQRYNSRPLILVLMALIILPFISYSQPQEEPLVVHKCNDFSLNGKGDNDQWDKTNWNILKKLDSGAEDYETHFKVLHSLKGIYVLFHGRDNKVTSGFDKDFQDLFRGDVFEVFFQVNRDIPLYYEYEISPRRKELILMIPRFNNSFQAWAPWHYEGDRKISKMVFVEPAPNSKNAGIKSWTAELFFPFSLFSFLPKDHPSNGNTWFANFYRLDYDTGKMIKWAWAPINQSFHEFEKFRPIQFE